MMRQPALWIAMTALIFCGMAQAEEADDTERSVLGGSPPIYASEPQAPAITTSYKRYRAIPHDSGPGTGNQTGERCATRVGLFGPGAPRPVGAACIGRSPGGQLFRGRVVPTGTSRFCVTAAGIFGPGAEQALGMPCSGETRSGPVQGRIATVDR